MRAVFDSMKDGDEVLVAITGTGRFKYRGQVAYKVESRALGQRLPWPYVPGKPWELIYFLRDVTDVEFDKTRLLTEIGYSVNDNLSGARRVRTEAMRRLHREHGSIDDFLKYVSGQTEPVLKRRAVRDRPRPRRSDVREDTVPALRPAWLLPLLADVQ